MRCDWRSVTIDSIKAERSAAIAIGPFGSRLKSDQYTPAGVPLIRGTNLTSGRQFSGEWVFVSEETADTLANCIVTKGDLVFPHRGAIGEVGIVDGAVPRYLLSSSIMKLTCNPQVAVPEFVYYFFKSDLGRHRLLENASQVGTPGIGQPLSTLKAIEIPLPPVEEQVLISEMLSSIDNKIANNRALAADLEAMARAIFKSWFVDFDPVKAKMEGRAPAGMDAETAALFPDELVESELGLIPKGWEVCAFSSIVDIWSGGTPKTKLDEYWGGGIPWFSVVDAPAPGEVFVISTQ